MCDSGVFVGREEGEREREREREREEEGARVLWALGGNLCLVFTAIIAPVALPVFSTLLKPPQRDPQPFR